MHYSDNFTVKRSKDSLDVRHLVCYDGAHPVKMYHGISNYSKVFVVFQELFVVFADMGH